ncbi:MAG: CheR family methyltransferase, partial [Methyloligellaceae bacterium]
GSLWQIDSSIRSMVKYQHFNLLDDYTPLGIFDIIFCRNVLIYFDPATKSEMLTRMAKGLRTEGYLVLGAAETVFGISDDYVPVSGARGLYAQNTATGAMAAPPAGSAAVVPAVTAQPAPSSAAALERIHFTPVHILRRRNSLRIRPT